MSAPPPSVERARAEGVELEVDRWFGDRDLLAETPKSERRTGVIAVKARVLARTTSQTTDALSAQAIAALARKAPEPSGPPAERWFRVLAAVHDATPRPCTHCSFSPRFVTCIACGGSGISIVRSQQNAIEEAPCPGCHGRKQMVCGNCDGSALAQRVTVVTVEERIHTLDYVFVPDVALELHAPLRNALTNVAPPDTLRVELWIRSADVGPYRMGPPASPTACGFPLDEVLRDVRASVDRMGAGGEHIHRDAECHALPVLVLDYEGAQGVLFNDVRGRLVGHAVKT